MKNQDMVLIPGAWLGSWAWDKVNPLLSKNGFNPHPLTLSSMADRKHLISENIGMETVINDVINYIEYSDLDQIVLVGHSFAGKVAAAVTDRIPDKISYTLYIDAFIPDDSTKPQGIFNPVEEYGKSELGLYGIKFSEKIIEMIGRDVKGKDRELMLRKGTEWPLKLATDPVVLTGNYKKVKEAYIFCLLPEKGKSVEEIYKSIKGEIDTLRGKHRIMESGHWPMISKPDELTKLMLELLAS